MSPLPSIRSRSGISSCAETPAGSREHDPAKFPPSFRISRVSTGYNSRGKNSCLRYRGTRQHKPKVPNSSKLHPISQQDFFCRNKLFKSVFQRLYSSFPKHLVIEEYRLLTSLELLNYAGIVDNIPDGAETFSLCRGMKSLKRGFRLGQEGKMRIIHWKRLICIC